ncbi:hypothetical protein CC85DRAFT_100843 [Cutaneotrichosporon oleaginosum]|uniref:Uncharacterized protein n=1 Tax=Cutaneotrichosporon oleaginosum TaxID=879819 RepID=A0A0J1B323_9TREE|nr:uncharacterized protein CC85DRAFT_100843 [Cutaneotrichosporon oleaginosum]KLT42009.1 hypothetical protein CC85DRAFT_100843 [Cutaneotrichosporon oleaginosum]TXT14334.1 hypothetical protein COLE_00527 [Cutaneotrichosporon oleaginosum]
MSTIHLARRSTSGSTALIAAAVVSCIAAALITLAGLWFYHRWLRRKQAGRADSLEKGSTPSSAASSLSAPPPTPYQVRQPRRARRPLIMKPSIPDLPRISEEPRMSLEPRASVSPSVHSRPGTVVGGLHGEILRAESRDTDREEVMGA